MFANVITIVGGYLVPTNQSHQLPLNGIPGQDWYQGFTKQSGHKLSIRVAGSISSLRAPSCTEDK